MLPANQRLRPDDRPATQVQHGLVVDAQLQPFEGVATHALDVELNYTFTYRMRPTLVHIMLRRDRASGTNWILVKRR